MFTTRVEVAGVRPSPARAAAATCWAACAAVLGACASGGGNGAIYNPAAGSQVTTRIDGGGTAAIDLRTVSGQAAALEVTVPAGADRAFAVLPAAYDAVQLPVNTVLPAVHTLGARDVRAPRRIGRQPLSRFLDCGVDASGTPHADAWAVTLTALTRVTPARDSASTAVTQVSASARPISTSGSTVNCTSSGALERAVNDALLARLRQ